MTDKEFRWLTRAELIEIIYALQKAQEELKAENAQMKDRLAQREIKLEQAGSLAEAALALNGVFEAAQAAADQYLEQIQADRETAQQLCDRLIADAQRKADAIVKTAQEEANALHAMSGQKAQQKWLDLQKKTDTMLQSYEALRTALEKTGCEA